MSFISFIKITHWLWAGFTCTSPFYVPSELTSYMLGQENGHWDDNHYCKYSGSYTWCRRRITFGGRCISKRNKIKVMAKSSGVQVASLPCCLFVLLWFRWVSWWNGTSWEKGQCASGGDRSLRRRTKGSERRQMRFLCCCNRGTCGGE